MQGAEIDCPPPPRSRPRQVSVLAMTSSPEGSRETLKYKLQVQGGVWRVGVGSGLGRGQGHERVVGTPELATQRSLVQRCHSADGSRPQRAHARPGLESGALPWSSTGPTRRLQGAAGEASKWGHEYIRHLAGAFPALPAAPRCLRCVSAARAAARAAAPRAALRQWVHDAPPFSLLPLPWPPRRRDRGGVRGAAGRRGARRRPDGAGGPHRALRHDAQRGWAGPAFLFYSCWLAACSLLLLPS